MLHPLQQIMGVQEASRLWGLPVEQITRLCAEGKLEAARLDGDSGPWVLVRDQVPPSSRPAGASYSTGAPRTTAADRASTMHSKLRDALYE